MADLNIKVGHTIVTHDGREGVVRYIGPLQIAAGEWLGLELADGSGKNDGSVKGQRYFDCPPGHGIFVRKESAAKVSKPSSQDAKVNGAPASTKPVTKPRPSSGVTADVARKRQSFMSTGSGTVPGSRLSLRSPTKSPTKPAPSSASSTGSTPRTNTPATTARTSDSSTKSRLSVAGRSSMGPPSSAARPGASATRQSMTGSGPKPVTGRPTSTQSRQSLAGSRMSMTPRRPLQSGKPGSPPDVPDVLTEEASPASVGDAPVPLGTHDADTHNATAQSEPHAMESDSVPPRQRSISSSSNNASTVAHEDKSRHAQIIKTLEMKLRALQTQRQEDQARIQNVQELQSKNTRYEGIIQALQKKLKTNQQEMADLKAKYDDAENRASIVPDRSAEHESELELATLDKEMAEERAEMYEAELEALKLKHEELELEAEILKEENRELTSIMGPEEKASAGWPQMERETERLRQALVMLRDMSQQNEADLKNEIKELRETLDELEDSASKYEEVAAKLNKSEETNQHLKEQLEAAEANDDILEAMETERDHNRSQLEILKRQIQDLEEHIQVTDELEAFHVDEEKRLHYQLDESEALLSDTQRYSAEQQKIIEDLEYTLTKFRDVVQGLQSDIDDLRRTRDISEHEASEMSSKSRAMMDLNLRLQTSAAKTQLKAIDLELGRMRAEQASSHLEIVQDFVPETFDVDKRPILAFLCFKRIKAKAQISKTVLADRIRERPDQLQDNTIPTFAPIETMALIGNLCDRFVEHLSSCALDDFTRYSGATFELEPVEHAVTAWVEALRRDEFAPEGHEHLQRMAGILVDMSEKLLSESRETKAMELLADISMILTYADIIGSQAQIVGRTVQAKLGPGREGDEDAMVFGKKMDQLGIRARTVKHVSSKLHHVLDDLRGRSMCLGESTWRSFADAEVAGQSVSKLMRRIGTAVMQELNKIEQGEEAISYAHLLDAMTAATGSSPYDADAQEIPPDDAFDILMKQLSGLQATIDDLHMKSADLSLAIEYERGPAPWSVRAKEVRAQNVLSLDLQEELAQLKSRVHEQTIRMSEKDRQLEEQQVKVEVLESRAKETKVKDDGVKAMKEEIETLHAEKAAALENLERLEGEYSAIRKSSETQKVELDAIKQSNTSNGPLPTGIPDETTSLRLRAASELLKVEISSLQAAIRFLKAENTQLRVPLGKIGRDASDHAWLAPNHLEVMPRGEKEAQLRAESNKIFTSLIDLAKASRPIRIRPQSTFKQGKDITTTPRQIESTTTLYQVLQQKEELERWNEVKDDLVQRAKIMLRPTTQRRRMESNDNAARNLLPATKLPFNDASIPTAFDGIHIVHA
ncbi:dynactin 1 [Exophiala viscosa]|uniref:Dynactin 1 n=1 Tax=Exophiala viscosa TaxID=2486360 RepID=A0AAN6DSD1_9EURO|nr:dynactin 1 [Exophiala viscosa]KAI1623801.1 dynactin 1 [Exophiala viscosa]